jgi:nicotinate-nucleotide adenylyltransferase
VIAAAAANAFALDRVIIAPTGRQPLKAEPALASFEDRLAMVKLAVQGTDVRFEASDFEASDMDRPTADGTPNYTVDLLDRMRRERPMDDLFAISGADSFLSLRRWKEPDRLLALAEWIVVSRPGFLVGGDEIAALELTEAQRGRVHVLSNLKEEVSATELRRRLAAGEDCGDLLPRGVEEFVRERGLYR